MAVENDLLECGSAAAWRAWLDANHDTSPGVWLLIAKKGSGVDTVSYSDAVEEALCFGWIDGQQARHDDRYFRQRFTGRVKRSPWSKINTERATRLIDAKRMRPAGQRQVADLDGASRYAILYRIGAVTKPETRARKIVEYVADLEQGLGFRRSRRSD